MFVEQNQEQVTEETLSTLENNNSDKVSVDNASDNQGQNMVEIKDYLAPELFNEIKVVNKSDLLESNIAAEISSELEEKYSNTFADISENSLIEGRVVGMNERDVLIDIGFKSEGIIDRSEFNENDLPAIGDQVEVYLRVYRRC